MRPPKQIVRILGVVAVFAAASLDSASGLDLKGLQKQAEQLKRSADKAAAAAQAGVNQAREGVDTAERAVNKAKDTADRGAAEVEAAKQKYDGLKQAAVAVTSEAQAVVADPTVVTDLLLGTAAVPGAVALPGRAAGVPGAAPSPEPAPGVPPAESPLDALIGPDSAPTVKVTRTAVLRGLRVQLGNYVFDEQVLQAVVTIGDANRGIGCIPQIMGDAALVSWLQDHAASETSFSFAVACPPDNLSAYSAASKAGGLTADVACELLEVTTAGGKKFFLVRPTHVDVKLASSASGSAGTSGD